mmetsp:Transcript_36822/g.56375  ORF Transcript_36822/g.56375 Transcript_36822/m.56375 type:complete len:93 (+) Transcript_36822:151-429(+)|eukprot:CAMPEP_0170492504 /NCGR_PEP_ID=MMETSP0208-20121228/12358_1 /TAXON_ID=197538 /ORGANISM="Strombidium inclinatum, Strain S3" /LENGTH=92 /DNA_ID=CAMNT_0010768255 /DNA_START=151 /DNA_END=429 /DNA_ORIENTATION=+
MCGESCILEKDYWKYKIFEPHMKKANSTDEAVCSNFGYDKYYETEVHGALGLKVTVDLYQPSNSTSAFIPEEDSESLGQQIADEIVTQYTQE